MNILFYEKVESTNIIAKELAESGAEHGTTVIANEQTAGRGRHGRSFYSAPGHGIYMSLVLEPAKLGFEAPAFVTVYSAVAVCEAIEVLCGKELKIKWVNDLFLGGKKICGILAESVTDKIILGIGINFTLPELPEELRPIVGAIFSQPLEKPPISRNCLAVDVIGRVLNPSYGRAEIIQKYKQRLFILGQKIRVEGAIQPYEAIALDVDEEGQLLVRNNVGEIITLSAGEISVRPSFHNKPASAE